jgi:hypothetical protein
MSGDGTNAQFGWGAQVGYTVGRSSPREEMIAISNPILFT